MHLCKKLFIFIISLIIASNVWAGSNEHSGCSIDMDVTTHLYTDAISPKDIEVSTSAEKDNIIDVGIVGNNINNLYGYEIRVKFDPEKLQFIRAVEEEASTGLVNILKKHQDAETTWMPATLIEDNTLSISNALKGSPDEGIAPDGSGILAIITFKVLDTAPENVIRISNAQYVDIQGAADNQQADAITNLSDGIINPVGDIDGNGIRELLDVIQMLKIMSDMHQGIIKLSSGDIVFSDKHTIDMQDVICLMNLIASH
jgi:hypothetical protein